MRLLFWALTCLAALHSQKADAVMRQNNESFEGLRKHSISNEVVFGFLSSGKLANSDQLIQELKKDSTLSNLNIENLELVLSYKKADRYLSVVKYRLDSSEIGSELLSELRSHSKIKWVKNNTLYEGEARDQLTRKINDPMYEEQSHHEIMQSAMAWMFTRGRKNIVVAVTDDGVDIKHEDLKHNIWANTNEIPDNGIDDDLNGYVDDVNGWDFSSGDNNPNPVSSWGGGGSHGTHVAGIVAGVANNNSGIAGTSPSVSVMPIRFYGSGSWTSTIVAKSYAYAVDNGAQIITTSYNIDGFVGDPVFEAAIDYAHENGVLHFNSAGNGYRKDPKRQVFDQLILVCSTETKEGRVDEKSDFSNYGTGVDLCAPGGDILSTVPNDKYKRMSGTSMAAPNAAAVAALIWSLNPSWTRDQVAAQLYASADKVYEQNSNLKGLLGAGRVNAFRAMLSRPPAPQIEFAELQEWYNPVAKMSEASALLIRFKGILKPDSVNNMRNWDLRSAGEDDVFGTADDQKVGLKWNKPYRIGSNQLELEFEDSLASGKYRLTALARGLVNPFNLRLDGDKNDFPGGNFIYEFDVEAEEPPTL